MKEPFSFEYTIQSEFTSTEKVLCMRCADVVEESHYREFPAPNNPSRIIYVPYLKPASHHVQVPVLSEMNNRLKIVHLQMCKSCEKMDIEPAHFPLIVEQCRRASVVGLLWAGYPQELIDREEEKWAKTKILRRLYGAELNRAYAGRLSSPNGKEAS